MEFDAWLRRLSWRIRGDTARRRKRKGGGSEPVAVEPNRPKLGEGGAAAALEFDD